MAINYGLIIDERQPEDYVFGGETRLTGRVLQEDGQWDEFLPREEMQRINGVETSACASFGTLNNVEILERRLFREKQNYSDRYLAKESGTTAIGNSPQKVAETLRKKGCPPESLWPFDSKIDTFEKYYAELPDWLYVQAVRFFKYNFGHEYVDSVPEKMMEALKYSPLGASVAAWHEGADGIYIKPEGSRDNHWCTIYGYEEGKYWKVFDSYDHTLKKYQWDASFSVVKRYTLYKQVIRPSAWKRFIKFLDSLL